MAEQIAIFYKAAFIPTPQDVETVLRSLRMANQELGKDAVIVGVADGFFIRPPIEGDERPSEEEAHA